MSLPSPRTSLSALCVLWLACVPVTPAGSNQPETRQTPVVHQKAAQLCRDRYVRCYDDCETDPANCDVSPTSPLCFPSIPRTDRCQVDCGIKWGCMPWDVGVETGLPCRWSDDPYECNFGICGMAATDCLLDCANVFRTTNPLQNLQHNCIERCYDHYGCRPRPSDPCNPMPEGYISCACPDAHGVECHPNDYSGCPF